MHANLPSRFTRSLAIWGGCVRVPRVSSCMVEGVGRAGYDPPFRLVGRHNEIWFFAV
jgi:hypothetical protein